MHVHAPLGDGVYGTPMSEYYACQPAPYAFWLKRDSSDCLGCVPQRTGRAVVLLGLHAGLLTTALLGGHRHTDPGSGISSDGDLYCACDAQDSDDTALVAGSVLADRLTRPADKAGQPSFT